MTRRTVVNKEKQIVAQTPKVKPNTPKDIDVIKSREKFIEAKFNIGYVDVINAFNNLAPNQRQIFNINNVPCKVSTDYDETEVDDMLSSFVDSVNNDIKNNVMSVHSVNSGWDEQVFEPTVKSGWDKVQESLGLPSSLYVKPPVKTHVKLIDYDNIVVYETENEIKYVMKIILAKEQIPEKLVIKAAFVLVKGVKDRERQHFTTSVVIENIDVMGFLTSQGMGLDHQELDDFYNFDSLERNNMISGTTVANELMHKYNMRRKVMQERIDNSDSDVQEKYATSPSPADYATYKGTVNILDDMFKDPMYD